MYERFYNLRERPFSLSPDPDYLYPSRVHREALSYLRYGIEGHAGFVVITGEIGSGKTTLLQTVMRGLDRQTAVARLVNTMLDARELIEAVMIDFGLDPSPSQSKPMLLRDLATFLVEQRRAGRLALLVVDEAQNLSLPALEEVRMLSNLETEKSKLVQIVLVGQPNLRDVLNRPELEQLRQRVSVSYHLEALDADETAAYVNHRLKRAAIGIPMEFPRPVTDLIHRHSQGLPRKINVVADAVLLFGYGEDQRVITTALVDEVIKDLRETGVLGERRTATPSTAHVPTPAAGDHDRDLALREARLVQRERELVEQQRVLSEEYRLLRTLRRDAPPADLPLHPKAEPTQPSGGRAVSAAAVAPPPAAVHRTATAVAAAPNVAPPAPVRPPAQQIAAPAAAPPARQVPVARPAIVRQNALATPRAVIPINYTTPASAPEAGSFWTRLRRQLSGFAKQVLED